MSFTPVLTRKGGAFDRLLHSETPNRTLVLVVSRRSHRSRTPFDANDRQLSCRGFRHVPTRAMSLRVPPFSPGGERTRHRGARGRSMQVRPGRAAFSRRDPHCAPCRSVAPRGVILPRGEPCKRAAGIPVASSSLTHRGRCSRSMSKLEGRQDRFRGGLVKGVRFLGPGHLPSPGSLRGCRRHRGAGRSTKLSSIARTFT